jgi:hypothetical protein
VPFGKRDSWARPRVNVRLGIQYTGYTRFDGGTSNYDRTGRSIQLSAPSEAVYIRVSTPA